VSSRTARHRRTRSARRPRAACGAALATAVAVTALVAPVPAAHAIGVMNDDQVVTGSQCVGAECSTTARPPMPLQLHVRDTPTLRLAQSDTGGYTAQTWDVAGNEANFFVRDLTGGSRLPFRIFPGAPTNALTLRDDKVGIGTSTPASSLDVSRDGARVSVTDLSTARGARVLLDLVNDGGSQLRLDDAHAGGQDWLLGAGADGAFVVRDGADGSPDAFLVTPAGTATARGVLQQSADPALRADVQPVDGARLLRALRDLDLTSWTTAGDASGARHLGPSGAGFHAAFGLGSADDAVAPADLASVALAAAQQLDGRLGALETAQTGLAGTVGDLRERLARVEPGAGTAPAADGGTLDRLTRDNAALRRTVKRLERARAAQARKYRSLAARQRKTERAVARLQRLLAATPGG